MGNYIRYEHRTTLTTILVSDNMDNEYACKIRYGESNWPWTLGGIGDVVAAMQVETIKWIGRVPFSARTEADDYLTRE
jgi:hypothetical protein